MIQKVTPQEAYDKVYSSGNSMLIDVRSSMEFLFVGHPLRSINVAWIDEPTWEINPDFTKEITKTLTNKFKTDIKSIDILLICRSGVRSVEAGNVLIKAGFTSVFSVEEGFEGDIDDEGHRGLLGGWRMRGLPWVQC